LVTNPSNGTLTLNPDGSFTYIPNAGYTGPDQFVYSKCDNGNPVACDTATAYITIPDVYLSIAGTVFNDGNGLTDSTVNGIGTNVGGLNAGIGRRCYRQCISCSTCSYRWYLYL
jgi:hypothetical protein